MKGSWAYTESMDAQTLSRLHELALKSLKDLETPEGILASGRDEAYGCIFGRDSLITAMELLSAYEAKRDPYLLQLVEKILRSLSNLQGRFENIESGEEPGKIIHEYRPERHEHLTQLQEDPWFVYPEGAMRNYDTVDATPLFLMAVARYRAVGDKRFAVTLEHSVRAALGLLLQFNGFVTYQFHPDRRHGGLRVQSWMDSTESLFFEEDDDRPPYPVAPVEVQAYAWAALCAWGDYFSAQKDADDKTLGALLLARALKLKTEFNEHFVLKGPRSMTLAFALDGNGRKLTAPRSSMGHVLWAAYAPAQKGSSPESILDQSYIEPLRRRLLSRDLFVPQAGIRTLSSRSRRYDPLSYHNGSIWPHDTAMLAQGLENFGYTEDAARVRDALLRAFEHFQSPIELFGWRRGFREYKHDSGAGACQVQAWSAAGLLSTVAATPSSRTQPSALQ